ncbi:Exosome complex exonuclease RRP40 [Zea mays]|uniref:Exosome complex exonuclease RRP40 n=1 Tax=Zea mays TaxID=4577 RepID=A0A1D6NGJ5_MAIZE|nr:Exosome complex exonuclease RRP40 [Zea mays]
MATSIGTLIYARVVKANSIMNPELSCMDACGMILSLACFLLALSGCSFTVLMLFLFSSYWESCRIWTAQRWLYVRHINWHVTNFLTLVSYRLLSSPTCPVLEVLGKKLSFEIAVGLNGRVWVNAPAASTVILVSNAIMRSESLSGIKQRAMVENLLERLS